MNRFEKIRRYSWALLLLAMPLFSYPLAWSMFFKGAIPAWDLFKGCTPAVIALTALAAAVAEPGRIIKAWQSSKLLRAFIAGALLCAVAAGVQQIIYGGIWEYFFHGLFALTLPRGYYTARLKEAGDETHFAVVGASLSHTVKGDEIENVNIADYEVALKVGSRAHESSFAHPTNIGYEGHTFQIQDFIDAIREGRDPLVTLEDASRAVALINAVYESSRTGKQVFLN